MICMRARYYSPDMRRFINADVVVGEISNAITLNRFAYANGNPVSMSDPFGLSAADQRGNPSSSSIDRDSSTIRYNKTSQNKEVYVPFISDADRDLMNNALLDITTSTVNSIVVHQMEQYYFCLNQQNDLRHDSNEIELDYAKPLLEYGMGLAIDTTELAIIYSAPQNVSTTKYFDSYAGQLAFLNKVKSVLFFGGLAVDGAFIIIDTGAGVISNMKQGASAGKTIWDAFVDATVLTGNTIISTGAGLKAGMMAGAALGTCFGPGICTIGGALVGAIAGVAAGYFASQAGDIISDQMKSIVE